MHYLCVHDHLFIPVNYILKLYISQAILLSCEQDVSIEYVTTSFKFVNIPWPSKQLSSLLHYFVSVLLKFRYITSLYSFQVRLFNLQSPLLVQLL